MRIRTKMSADMARARYYTLLTALGKHFQKPKQTKIFLKTLSQMTGV